MLGTSNRIDQVTGFSELAMCREKTAKTKATARKYGYTPYPNIPQLTLEVDAGEVKKKKRVQRGFKRTSKARRHDIGLRYKGKFAELSPEVAELLVFADPDQDWGSESSNNTQTGLTATAGTAWDFDAGDDGIAAKAGNAYEILDASGNRVPEITTLAIAGTEAQYGSSGTATVPEEGVDYRLEKSLGLIIPLKDVNNDVWTPTITSKTITTSSDEIMTRLKGLLKAGIERMFCAYIWDDEDKNNLVVRHEHFLGYMTIDEGFDADGDADIEPGFTIEIEEIGEDFYVRGV